MANKVTQLLNGGIRYGKDNLKTAAASYEPGLLVKVDTSGSTVTTSGSTAATAPFGFLYGNRHHPYTPTTRVYASGEAVTVVFGDGIVALSTDFFVGATLPAVGDLLYAGPSGLWSVTNSGVSSKVGRCIEQKAMADNLTAAGTPSNVAIVQFSFAP